MGKEEAGVGAPRTRRARATLRDVAEAAGTSRSTASRALGGHGYVAEHIKKRVREAADRLGYVPDASARTLKGSSSGLVGLLVSDLRNQFYAELAAGVEHTLSAAGYQVVLADDHGDEHMAQNGARAFLAMRADGVLLAPVGRAATELLVEHETPVVEVDRRSGVRGCDAVAIDSEHGARAAVEHLIALGHREIAVVIDETKWETGKGRVRGYRAALRAAGLPASRRHVLDLGLTPSDHQEELARFLDRATGVTAVFAANNVVAELVWQELKRRGSGVPERCSVVSFDDLGWMRMVEPGITAVRQPVFEMGSRGAELLLERVGNGGRRRSTEVLRPELVVRGSTAAPKH
ncbi:LacI family DNA-binding transcriptional regulator [Streptomyces montanisoli]|uniref:LacI family DNA-binding transcriptional regulator n=1 Tax=Streptomyces montanisoli TaxID=2798581 RepID=A0A940M7I8_9ACTN|nr:LacI family DNA-binding transcriptional regulator [Streptomyces montanisoli]MBP0457620.1 LacI family DNA-binding transcriptional regulator [Streptomyces montanisoli]